MIILTLNRKAYKQNKINIIRMFPSDPTGSLDDFFLFKILGGYNGKNTGFY